MGIIKQLCEIIGRVFGVRSALPKQGVFAPAPIPTPALPTYSLPPETGVVEISSVIPEEDCRALAEMGVEFSESDKWFPDEYVRREKDGAYLQKVRLPRGWCKRRVGDTSYWWGIFDEKGRERASMFYKGVSYDRRTHMTVHARYNLTDEVFEAEGRRVWSVCDVNGATMFASSEYRRHTNEELIEAGETDRDLHSRMCEENEAEHNRAIAECEAWLDTNFPEWRKKTAYWD